MDVSLQWKRMSYGFFVTCLTLAVAHAEGSDSSSKEALRKTQSLLQDPAQRQSVIQESRKAKVADDHISSLTSDPATREKIYQISSQVFGEVVKNSGGDSAEMESLIERAQKDPEAFYRGLSPESRRAIQEVSKEIDSRAPAAHRLR